jgi:hypothetical protein
MRVAGAGGFEPPHGGTKIRCLTAWLRPNRTEPRARIIWSFGSAQGPARSSKAAKDISRLAAYTAVRVWIKWRANSGIVGLIAAPPQHHSTPTRKPVKRPSTLLLERWAAPIDPRATYPFRRLVSCARAVGMIAVASRWRSDHLRHRASATRSLILLIGAIAPRRAGASSSSPRSSRICIAKKAPPRAIG